MTHLATIGRVMLAMGEYASARAGYRHHYLGPQNKELLSCIGHTLVTGARKCLEIAQQDVRDDEAEKP